MLDHVPYENFAEIYSFPSAFVPDINTAASNKTSSSKPPGIPVFRTEDTLSISAIPVTVRTARIIPIIPSPAIIPEQNRMPEPEFPLLFPKNPLSDRYLTAPPSMIALESSKGR